MLNNEKTREGVVRFTGSGTENLEKGSWGEDTALPRAFQEKCVRCPYSPGGGHACNLVPCPFSGRHDGQRIDHGRGLGHGGGPLNYSRRNKRLSCLPRMGKSLVRISAAEAPALSGGLLSHVGRVATSSIREDWRHRIGRGALLPCLFVYPQLFEVPHD